MSPAAGASPPVSVRTSTSISGSSLGIGLYAPSRSISGAALTSALSAMPGIEAWPLRPRTMSLNGEDIFSAVAQR